MERNLAVDRDTYHIWNALMHIKDTQSHTFTSHTQNIHTCTHTHYVNTNLKVLADVHNHCT